MEEQNNTSRSTRRKFTPADMEHPEDFYGDIAKRLYYAERYAINYRNASIEKVAEYKQYIDGETDKLPEFGSDDERLAVKLCLGEDDFQPMIDNVITINRCFHKLLKSLEPLGALALVRMQIDNLKHIYAETKHPGKVLYRIYENGRELNQIKIDGKAINASELIQELDEKHGRIREIWKTYCQYVHPSKRQTEVRIYSYFDYLKMKELPTENSIKYFSWDMVYVNMVIASTLYQRLSYLLAIVKSRGNYGFYKRVVKEGEPGTDSTKFLNHSL